jgi:hypothetical protein
MNFGEALLALLFLLYVLFWGMIAYPIDSSTPVEEMNPKYARYSGLRYRALLREFDKRKR